jgi:hypothetical protein
VTSMRRLRNSEVRTCPDLAWRITPDPCHPCLEPP